MDLIPILIKQISYNLQVITFKKTNINYNLINIVKFTKFLNVNYKNSYIQ